MQRVRQVAGQLVEFGGADGTGAGGGAGGMCEDGGVGGVGSGIVGGVAGGRLEGGEAGGEGDVEEGTGGEGEEVVVGFEEEGGEVVPAEVVVHCLEEQVLGLEMREGIGWRGGFTL